MAVRPGEENVATLFGDIHYFYGPPTANPPHHRFDKGSYIYLFENANDRRARIEVANQPGTEDQDAFDGFLDNTRVRYSYNQQCLVTITVDGIPGAPVDPSQWHLPTYDPRNENKYHYKLHSLDIYFWTQTDALQFVNGIRRVLPQAQVEVLDEPGPPAHSPHHAGSYHHQELNPLVQKLENAAISDPPYSTPKPSSQSGVPSFDPPPISAVHGASDSPQSFAPMAYNPAAPAAPEQIRHREKTPPPPEDDGLDPLQAAVARDHAPAYASGFGPNGPLSPGFPGPPGPPTGAHPSVTSPGFPPSQHTALASPGFPFAQHPSIASPGFPPSQFGNLQRSATMPGTAALGSPGLASPYGSNFPVSPGFAPHQPTPPPGSQGLASPGLPPPGGYSQYNYGNPGATPQGGSQYGIHQQVYLQTQGKQAAQAVQYKPKQEGRSKLGDNADRLERGVTGMLKKFEKKFG
ncbi:uncharacterized protein BCR38DRAFT_333141 [Pseudomassariella vexata]|uniref:RNA recognition motif-containing protein n=1 Tax=Pseudomassariella vexata TaxID=1141098 RepID=A0A1Y2EF94_9PEZI|nr:uncharacterized protein BCR38DRAFT_333141 [Pseudomassariella vexata]ORY70258.1 hypothetical protein BCR38DRAFT_333141 [Pseudomassariella vexata]